MLFKSPCIYSSSSSSVLLTSISFCVYRSRFISQISDRNPRPMATEEPIVATEEPIVATEVIDAAETVAAEDKPSGEAAEVQPKKALAKRKPRNPSLHPPYFEVLIDLFSWLIY